MKIIKPEITPGKWEVTGELDQLRVGVTESEAPHACDGWEQVAHVVCGDYELAHYEMPARNAVAIAAVPEMLQALVFAFKYAGMKAEKGDPLPAQLMKSITDALMLAGCTIS